MAAPYDQFFADLAAFLKDRGPLPVPLALSRGDQLCGALARILQIRESGYADEIATRLQRGQTCLDDRAKPHDARVRDAPVLGSRSVLPEVGWAQSHALGRLDYLASLQAAGADIHAARRAVVVDADALEVGVEAALGRDHRVASTVAEAWLSPAHVAHLGHGARV